MAAITPYMGLKVWNLLNDSFDHTQLAENFAKIDQHNHAEGKGVQIPTGGIAAGAISTEKMAEDSVTDAKILKAPVRGFVASTGVIQFGTGFTVAHTGSTGIYTLTFSPALPTAPVVTPVAVGNGVNAVMSTTTPTTTTAIIWTTNSSGTLTDGSFHFIAYPNN